MLAEEKSISIRISPQLLKKLQFVAKYEGRSANSQILYLIRQSVIEFENKNGKVDESLKEYL